jgi:hypothetical protein
VSFWNSALSSPRGAFMSISSMMAFCLRLANRNRLISRLLSRSGRFAVDEQSKPLLEGQRCDVRLSLLFVERLRHAGEPERDEAAVGGMCQHRRSFPQW